ncbi:acyl-CoA thioesterase [Tamaricihabitans halophyticus]|uniref:acyl-CoA thioesterase n=1 Tax=Tamaricihabitans halophyticus TaxID=1262583 RepID=UPI001043C063|nr:acyl-CoA thioesterase [Tamaricihabitans halophyticus]
MTAATPFSVRMTVRNYELDTLGHVNQAVYHSYGEVARTSLFDASGCQFDKLMNMRLGAVLLQSTINYRRELRANDEFDASADVRFGTGKSFHIDTVLTKVDGTVSAEITCVLGLMDLDARRLVTDPRARFADAGADIALLTGRRA